MAELVPRSPFATPAGSTPAVGIATFAGYPFWRPGLEADLVILGVPYDEGTTNKPGTRFGPRAVREASMLYTYEGQQDRFYDADRRRWILRGKVIADAGDVNIQPLSLEHNWEAITEAVRLILAAGAAPAVIGGDHSITHPVMRAFKGGNIHYLHLATNVDCDRQVPSPYTHGSAVARIHEEGLAASITIIGVRGLTNWGPDVAWIQEQGARVITARELRAMAPEELAADLPQGPAYLSLDINFFDPAAAPAAGIPEPGGFFFHEFSDLVQVIASRLDLVGFDVVEVSPFLDGHDAATSHLAARCVIELASAAVDKG